MIELAPAQPSGWTSRRLDSLVQHRNEFGDLSLPLLGVSAKRGVVLRDPDEGRAASDDLTGYRVVRRGDLVVNKLVARDRAFGIAKQDGLVSPAYWVLRPEARADGRFLDYCLGSSPGLAEIRRQSKDMPPAQFDWPWPSAKSMRVHMPPFATQRAIADFLDRECARIEELARAASELAATAYEPVLTAFAEATKRLPLGRIHYRYEIQLGKMLDAAHIDPVDVSPYLRNANVQWDRLHLDDLSEMTFSAGDKRKFSLVSGDLLICEGGVVGRCAIWNGEIADCYYQKALHRARPRGEDSTRYLLYCLRLMSERGDFAADGTGSTILHLPAERLRATRIPLTSPDEQREIVERVDAVATRAVRAQEAVQGLQIELTEYRDALITEAVTGQLEVSATSDQRMSESLAAVAEGEQPEVLS